MNNTLAPHHFEICKCELCNGEIQFMRSQAGSEVECPHCGASTVARLRAVNPLPPAPKPYKAKWIIGSIAVITLIVGIFIFGGAGGFMVTAFGSLGLFAAAAVYMLPSIIADRRNHPNGAAIFLLNVFLGWTFLGWIGALVWSSTDTRVR